MKLHLYPKKQFSEFELTVVILQGEHNGIKLHNGFRLTLPNSRGCANHKFSQHSLKCVRWGCLLKSPQLWKKHATEDTPGVVCSEHGCVTWDTEVPFSEAQMFHPPSCQVKYLLERVWCHPGHIKCPIFSLRQRETFCLLMSWIKCPKLSQNVIWPLTIHDFNSRCKARCRQNSEWDVANAFTSIMKQVVLLARYCTMHLSFERTCPWSRCPCFLQGKMQGPSQFFGQAHTASKWWRQGSKPGSVSLQNLFPTLL